MNEEFKLVEAPEIAPEQINQEPVAQEPVKIITPEPEAPKRGRGRPKKETPGAGTGEPKAERKKNVTGKSLFDELRERGKQYSEPKEEVNKEVPPGVDTPPAPTSNLLNGYLILLICDAFLPLVVVKIAHARGNKGITTKQLKLTAAEKKELEPLADACANQILPSMSPISQFLLAISSVYITKVV